MIGWQMRPDRMRSPHEASLILLLQWNFGVAGNPCLAESTAVGLETELMLSIPSRYVLKVLPAFCFVVTRFGDRSRRTSFHALSALAVGEIKAVRMMIRVGSDGWFN